MKKLSGLFLVLVMIFALWLTYREKPAPIPPSASALGSREEETRELRPEAFRPVMPPAVTGEISPTNPRNPVPALETESPVYRSALILLETRFLRLIEREKQTEAWPPEQLVNLANRLAVIRLSLAMHEASIADHWMSENEAVIAVPAYPRVGEDFQSQVLALLPPDFGSEDFKRQLMLRFGHFGRYAQKLEVKSVVRNIEDQPVKHFEITHRFELDYGSSMGVSQLTDIYLGPYAAFIGGFPKE